MKRNCILFIYATEKDCITIRNTLKGLYNGIHFNLTIAEKNHSLEKIYKKLKPDKNDYIIAIDHNPRPVFIKDCQKHNLIHLESLSLFRQWLDKMFT